MTYFFASNNIMLLHLWTSLPAEVQNDFFSFFVKSCENSLYLKMRHWCSEVQHVNVANKLWKAVTGSGRNLERSPAAVLRCKKCSSMCFT